MSDLSGFSPDYWLRGELLLNTYWLRSELLLNTEEMKKYWIACIYSYRQSYVTACNQKARWIDLAQDAFLFASGLLLVALLEAAWRGPALLHRLGVG